MTSEQRFETVATEAIAARREGKSYVVVPAEELLAFVKEVKQLRERSEVLEHRIAVMKENLHTYRLEAS